MEMSATVIRRPWISFQVAVLCLLVTLPYSSQRHVSHLHGQVGEKSDEYVVGLIASYQDDYETLVASGDFEPISTEKLYGRTFYTGRMHGTKVVYVESGPRRLNAGVAVHILMDTYKASVIIQYGTAGSANSTLNYGDVNAPESLAYTGCWEWLKYKGLVGASTRPELLFSNYGPENGENRLEGIQFKPEVVFSEEGMESVYSVKTASFSLLWESMLQDVKLENCVGIECAPTTPKVVFGLKGSTSDIFVDNAAYRDFLVKKFKVSTVDQESAAVVMAAKSGAVPVYVFQGVSDLAGGDTDYSSTSLSSLPGANALKVAVEFIRIMRLRSQWSV
eukprot:TRINITY_DN50_c0_g1_i6.p1 TRINITY_DN50_c0_g1~~TRINITY_DN50_c0_g1_i6.p1  ORF type:complete len:334 (-),score=19.81 TRINITY_DN50_c0_g1_i6:373-1374(-)